MDTNVEQLTTLRENKYVREKELSKDISSFNFTPKAFWEQHWDEQTIKARGLFLDPVNGHIIARSYDKFFNYQNEQLVAPIAVYKKYNGFLGICAAHPCKKGELLLCSKSTNVGIYAEYFSNIMNQTLSAEQQSKFSDFLRVRNMSAVFEVIDPINDPHIVEYFHPQLVLLDFIYNDWEFNHVDYALLLYWGEMFGFNVKQRYGEFFPQEHFNGWLKFAKNAQGLEGWVVEDGNHSMYKIKTEWYIYWKQARKQWQMLKNGYPPQDLPQCLIDFMEDNASQDWDIIQVRKNFMKEQNNGYV